MSESAEKTEVRGFDSYPIKLGDIMRGERATLSKSLLDVQRDLRVKAAYIAAIENTDPNAFQTPGFIAGYVRSYARYLGLDPEETFVQFCAESGFDGVHPGISKKPKPTTPTVRPVQITSVKKTDPFANAPSSPFMAAGDGILHQVSASGLGSVLILMTLILGIGYGAWAVLQDIQRVEFSPVNENPVIVAGVPVEQPDSPLDVQAQGVTPTGSEAASLDRLYRPKELDVPVMTPRDGPIAALDSDRIGALVPNNGGISAEETAALMEVEAPRVTELAGPEVAIVASRPAWVRVSMADGTVLFERILDGGESFQLPAGAETSILRAGNSGAVYLTVNGKPFGPIGTDTAVAKNVALAPAAIMKTYPEVSDRTALKTLASPRVITLNKTGNSE